jgi:nitroreductase
MDTQRREDLLQARYGDQVKPQRMIWNDQVEALLRHRSVRAFLPEPLPEGALEAMVAAAQSASTSSNLHQWSVVAVDEPELKEQLIHLSRGASTGSSMPFLRDASTILLWVADTSRNQAISRDNGGGGEVFEHVDAFLMASLDAALAAQNAVVAAESMGLGVVYLGMMRNRAKELAELIGLPPYSFVVFGMAVGTPDPERRSDIRPRPAQSVILHRNRYSAAADDAWVDEYEE